MNKLFKILLFGASLLTLLKCDIKKDTILINQIRTNKPVKVRLTLIDSTIFGFKFPNKFSVRNNNLSEKSFIEVDYFYKDSLTKWRNLGIELYKEKLGRISNNKKKTIPSKGSLDFVYVSFPKKRTV